MTAPASARPAPTRRTRSRLAHRAVVLTAVITAALALQPGPATAIKSIDTATCPEESYAKLVGWFRDYAYLEIDGLAVESAGSGLRMVEVRAAAPGSHDYAAAMGIDNWEAVAVSVECTDLLVRRWAP